MIDNSKKRPHTTGVLEDRVEKLEQPLDTSSKVPIFAGHVDKRFSSIEEQISGLKARSNKVEELLPVFEVLVNERFSKIEGQLSGLKARSKKVEKLLPAFEVFVNERFSRIEEQLSGSEARVEKPEC